MSDRSAIFKQDQRTVILNREPSYGPTLVEGRVLIKNWIIAKKPAARYIGPKEALFCRVPDGVFAYETLAICD